MPLVDDVDPAFQTVLSQPKQRQEPLNQFDLAVLNTTEISNAMEFPAEED